MNGAGGLVGATRVDAKQWAMSISVRTDLHHQ